MKPTPRSLGVALSLVVLPLAGCGTPPAGSGPNPEAPAAYAALPDTLVCVVDRAAPAGLTQLAAKKDGADVVVLDGGQIVDLDVIHPVNVIAGYAGTESWVRRAEPITHQGARYAHVGGERRVGIELLDRIGENRGILLFAGADDDPPPDALYIPTAPGCIFQPYVREDLIRR